MPICFVIQPFDGARFDKRYDDVFAPAIKEAGLEPYRTDKDPDVDIPIDAIEDGIKNSLVCLADITTDNPNVWYELGYAFAIGRPVVMVCASERVNKYPFDIQHRSVIRYDSDSPSDFTKLKSKIEARITAILKRDVAIRSIRESENIAPVDGLSQFELAVLASAAGSMTTPNDMTPASAVKMEVERGGFAALAFTLGMRRLIQKNFLELVEDQDDFGNQYSLIRIATLGWDWIEANHDKFVLTKDPPSNPDDIPF